MNSYLGVWELEATHADPQWQRMPIEVIRCFGDWVVFVNRLPHERSSARVASV